MLRIFLWLSFLSGCMIPTYITKHGVKVYDKTTKLTPTQTEVEEITQCVINEIGGQKKIYGTKVMLVNKWIQIPSYNNPREVELADGITNIWDKEIIASVFQTCLADSSLIHELAHIIHDSNSKVPDWWHDDKEFWAIINEMETRIIEDLCPKNYVHKEISENYNPDSQ